MSVELDTKPDLLPFSRLQSGQLADPHERRTPHLLLPLCLCQALGKQVRLLVERERLVRERGDLDHPWRVLVPFEHGELANVLGREAMSDDTSDGSRLGERASVAERKTKEIGDQGESWAR